MFVMYLPKQCLWKKWRHSVFMNWSSSWMLLRQMMQRTTGTFLAVRNSLPISMSSNMTGQPLYSSHLEVISSSSEATALSSKPRGFLIPSPGGEDG